MLIGIAIEIEIGIEIGRGIQIGGKGWYIVSVEEKGWIK